MGDFIQIGLQLLKDKYKPSDLFLCECTPFPGYEYKFKYIKVLKSCKSYSDKLEYDFDRDVKKLEVYSLSELLTFSGIGVRIVVGLR